NAKGAAGAAVAAVVGEAVGRTGVGVAAGVGDAVGRFGVGEAVGAGVAEPVGVGVFLAGIAGVLFGSWVQATTVLNSAAATIHFSVVIHPDMIVFLTFIISLQRR
ncbi:MAG: hypothetical protein HW384_1220, partial [Dehalococcoidia bacterium]|nr:hypothetical protein [Dehalococcoidia bacterium]